MFSVYSSPLVSSFWFSLHNSQLFQSLSSTLSLSLLALCVCVSIILTLIHIRKCTCKSHYSIASVLVAFTLLLLMVVVVLMLESRVECVGGCACLCGYRGFTLFNKKIKEAKNRHTIDAKRTRSRNAVAHTIFILSPLQSIHTQTLNMTKCPRDV